MTIPSAIAEAQANSDPPPPNESTTCEWIIYPLLLASGYQRRDIVSRIADNNGQYPDYTILQDSNACWFLEAKAWSVALEDKHAQQSLNYANQNGKRWVVLSNGREWRLYDNTIQGLASDKHVVSVKLDEADRFSTLLTALGKPSVNSGGLERFAVDAKLAVTLGPQMADSNSEVIRAIHSVMRRQPGLSTVSKQRIVAYLQGQLDQSSAGAGSAALPTETAGNQTDQSADCLADTNKSSARSVEEPQGFHSFTSLLSNPGRYVTCRKPKELRLPDGNVLPTPTWSSVVFETLKHMASEGRLPDLPVLAGARGKRYFLNSSPIHSAGKEMTMPKRIDTAERPTYVELHWSGADLLTRVSHIVNSKGYDPAGFAVKLNSLDPTTESP